MPWGGVGMDVTLEAGSEGAEGGPTMRPDGTKASVLAHVPRELGSPRMPRRRGGQVGLGEVEGGHKPPPRLTSSGSLTTVITLLIILRRRLRKQARATEQGVPEIHEQLVTYDEEGGGEMDTTSYDVSVLNSVRHGGPSPAPGAGRGRPLRSGAEATRQAPGRMRRGDGRNDRGEEGGGGPTTARPAL